jgi:metal-responsive CopG/Arc/MetJ family transcriptional regulator
MGYRSSSAKVKVTATLDADLVKAIDASLSKADMRSRSQMIEEILRGWQETQKRREIERQVEAYYVARPKSEQEEDEQWSRISSRAGRRLWED